MPVDHIWMFPNKPSRLWSISSKIVLSLVGSTSKLWTDCLNSFNIVNKDVLYDAIEKRPVNQGLVTVSNHYSCIDEPVLWGILKWRYLIGGRNIRWTLGADNICFTKYWHSLFFSLGRVVPVCRGEGVYQKSLDFVLDQLNAGQWLHMFPEGRVNLSKEFMRLKWGVGRLIADCNNNSLVLPIWLVGMDSILPNKKPYIPKIGKTVTVLIGEPIQFKSDVQQLQNAGKNAREIRKYITDRIQDEFRHMKIKAERIHYESLYRS
ncbi:tafazzin-like isoform X1 [Octopus vulgaris]|uniref:Tafazzin family protein n=1 Tax=Octopus vulgaris TaxID=6645 RepID=A0AA36FCL1_OCTVU|nr:tafazzin-like isoform X1 [Octopus vulgaris]